jgi:autotransporter translocation and assembly factor TamB
VIAGRTSAPQLSLTAGVRELAAGPIARSRLDADVRWEDGRATGRLTIAGLGGSVVVVGNAPAPLPGLPAGGEALDLTITARDLAITRMAQWAPQIVRAASGTVRGDLHLGGTWTAPRPEGTLALRASVLQLVASGARWEDVTAELRADGARGLVIERFTATGGQGTVAGTGRFDFDGGLVPTAEVRLEFDHFLAVDRPVLEAAVNGRLRVVGSLTAPTVRGRLYVPEGAVRPGRASRRPCPCRRERPARRGGRTRRRRRLR